MQLLICLLQVFYEFWIFFGKQKIGFSSKITQIFVFRSMSAKTAIQYYIPEDGDDLEHPNIFILEKELDSITLRDIRKVIHVNSS